MNVPEQGYDVFISYSRVDKERVGIIRDRLQAHGLKVFFDAEGIDAGAEYPEVIDRAVKGAKAVLACWTQEAVERRWVRIESRIALDRNTLVAVAIHPMKHDDLPAEFYNVNMVDLSTFTGDEAHPGWQAMLRALFRKTRHADSPITVAAATTARKPLLGSLKAKVAVGLVGLALLAGGGYILMDGTSQFGSSAHRRAAPQELAASFRKTAASIEPILVQAAEARIEEIARNEAVLNTRLVWAAAQLAGVSTGISAKARADFETVVERLLAHPCSCVIVEGAKLTIVSGWLLRDLAIAGKPLPPMAIETVLAAQRPRGWWSSTLDATDMAANGSVYITAFTVLALDEAELQLPAGDSMRDRIGDARSRAIGWMRASRPQPGRHWADYPDNHQRSEHPVFTAMATIILLRHGDRAGAHSLASALVQGIDKVAGPFDNFSNDTPVEQESGRIHIDTFRHVPMGWQVHALALALPHLDGKERVRAGQLLAEAAAMSLNVDGKTRQEWMVAENALGLTSAAVALAKSRPD